jgi:hypothetical protein
MIAMFLIVNLAVFLMYVVDVKKIIYYWKWIKFRSLVAFQFHVLRIAIHAIKTTFVKSVIKDFQLHQPENAQSKKH